MLKCSLQKNVLNQVCVCIVGSVLVLRVYSAKVDDFDTMSLVFSLMCLVRQIIVFQHTEAQCYVKLVI
jgi:hypothetical protein